RAALVADLRKSLDQQSAILGGCQPALVSSRDKELLARLTAREIEVLKFVGDGKRTKEIAYLLGVSVKTAVTHRTHVMEKLGIHEGPGLVRFALRAGVCKL